MKINDHFDIRLRGDLGRQLETFRGLTGLSKHGRLSDDWDQDFGSRTVAAPDATGELGLWRYEDDDWTIALHSRDTPLPDEQVDEVRRQVLAAAAEVGMTIVATHFRIRLSGPLDEHVEAFRATLGLSAGRRLPDGNGWYDSKGFAAVTAPTAAGELTLQRFDDDDWRVALVHVGNPLPAEQVDEIRQQVLAAAAEAGLTVTAES